MAPRFNLQFPKSFGSALRWFLAEFLVVLSGVLVAVALGNHFKEQDINRNNRQYLRDLLMELEHNSEEVLKNLEVEERGQQAAINLLSSIDTVSELPADSLAVWLSYCLNSTINYRPRMGTVKAMLTLGSVNSLKNVKLRAAIINYEQEAIALEQFFNQMTMLEFGQARRLVEDGNAQRLLEGSRSLKPIRWTEVKEDPKYEKLYLMSLITYSNRVTMYKSYDKELQKLKKLLRTELGLPTGAEKSAEKKQSK